jgi:glycosyltransferase involved in cell wall biosynthesis
MLAARLAGVPIRIYTLRGLRVETISPGWRPLFLRLERLAAASATRVVCVSESLRERALELELFPDEKAEVLGSGSSNGVDTDRFGPRDIHASKTLRDELGIPEGARVLGFVGRLVRDKGIEDLAEVFLNSVSEDYPDAYLILIGEYEESDPVQEETRQLLESHSNVLHLGFVEDVAPYYGTMNLLVFPSFREGFPNAPLEAAASGLPVVGYGAIGTVDAVVDGRTGTLVPVGNREALFRSISAYLDSAELVSDHGAAGRERAVKDFRRELVWERWSAFYQRELESSAHQNPVHRS